MRTGHRRNLVMGESKERLLELYEAHGDLETFVAAKRLYEQALAGEGSSDPEVLVGYGYLLDCHGRITLRQAAAAYERAVALDPGADKPRYQLISAQAALGEPEAAVALYRERLARSPGEVREHRFLANAHLAAREFGEAGTLADWRRAVDDADNLGPVYLSAFLLERLGRLGEAAAAWQSILDWCDQHDAPLTAEWPRRELARLRARLSDG